jgi:hypothetical protein
VQRYCLAAIGFSSLEILTTPLRAQGPLEILGFQPVSSLEILTTPLRAQGPLEIWAFSSRKRGSGPSVPPEVLLHIGVVQKVGFPGWAVGFWQRFPWAVGFPGWAWAVGRGFFLLLA